MTEPASGPLGRAPTFARFAQIADTAAYAPLPDDWLLGCADIVGSTQAIRAGRYKTVNMAGAAVIAAVSNEIGGGSFAFVFGGDGASFVVPPDRDEATRRALAATATFVQEEFGLTLRVALIPLGDVRAAGWDVRVAYFAASANLSYAMFTGGGLAWADEEIKAGRYAIAPAPAGTRPDLSGLSCRFDQIPSRQGVILSLIVRPATGRVSESYHRVIAEILALVENAQDMGRPVPAGGPRLTWPSPGIDLEARIARGRGSLLLAKLSLLVRSTVSHLLFRFRLPVGGFDPDLYLSDLVANSDYRKYDDGLRMTIDCRPELADEIEARLQRAAEAGEVRYGLHRQDAALMTCITHSVLVRDHVHFIDGASGGYAAAASRLKAAGA